MGGLKLWELDQMLRDAVAAAEQKVDPETGEIPEDWANFLDEIQMEKNKKCLAIAALYKEYNIESEAVYIEAKNLLRRANACKSKADALKRYLAEYMCPGEKLKNDYVQISWRKSELCVVDNIDLIPDQYLRIIKEANKTEIKSAIQRGLNIPGARIEERQNLTIK